MEHSVLVLPSWYPTKLDEYDGDFVKRHIEAISLYCKQYVIFIVKDEKGLVTKNITIEETSAGNITEIIIYYKSVVTGIGAIDKLFSLRKYISLYKTAIKKCFANNKMPLLTHVHSAYKAGILAAWIKKKWGVPYMVTEHWTGFYKYAKPNIYEKNRVRKNITLRVLKEAKLFIPVTNNLGNYVNEHLQPIQYKSIPNVVNTNLFKYKKQDLEVFSFAHVSTMGYQKNVEGIIQACSILKKRGANFIINFIGNKPPDLLALAKKEGLLDSIVFFYDAITYDHVAKKLQHSNALVMFSRFENLPCVILESLCCGTPVISTSVGGIAEVMDERNGILIPENLNELANAMERMMHKYDHYDRAEIAKCAQQKFSYEVVGKAFADIYQTHFAVV